MRHKIQGTGHGIAIVMSKHGLGDDLCAMPALKWLSERGRVAVFCDMSTPFNKEAREKMFGSFAEVYDAKDVSFGAWRRVKDGKGYFTDLKEEFEKVFYLNEWSVRETNEYGMNLRTPIELFARLTEAGLPEYFSWKEYLTPEIGKSFVIYAPDSSGAFRRLLHQFATYLLLKLQYGNVKAFGVTESKYRRTDRFLFHKYVQFKNDRVKKFFRLYNKTAVRVQRAIVDFIYPMNYIKSHTKSFSEFISLIYSAKKIITGDNGIMNFALALEKPVLSVFGMTDETKIAEQYARFTHKRRHIILQDRAKAGCSLPCNGKHDFTNGMCHGTFTTAQCMRRIKPLRILRATKQLI